MGFGTRITVPGKVQPRPLSARYDWLKHTVFIKALYEWDPGEDPEEQDNESILDAELYEPRSKVASLQALFAMMQYTKRKFVDPTDFICKLGLNPSVQQDAQVRKR